MIKKILLIFLVLAGVGLSYIGPVTSFNTGQVSPLVEARGDFSKYSSSCRTLENMFVTVQGPAIKRPGTVYIATAKYNAKVRLIPFEYSTDDAYILLLGNEYMRFFRNGAPILDGSGNPVEIVTPFETADLFNIKYVQAANEIYLVDNENPPQILSREDHDDWTIADAVFTNGPFLPENDIATTITPSGSNGSITLTASADIFESATGESHVGSLWSIQQVRETSIVEGTFGADENETSISTPFFIGDYSFATTGAGLGTVTLQRSTNNGISWRNALTPLTDELYDNPAETEEDGAQYRITRTGADSGVINYEFKIANNLNPGIVEITAVASATSATATVIIDLAGTTATSIWREGYWSDFRGWPSSVTIYQQRLVYGGSETYPQTIWFGEQNPSDYTNFLEGTLDTSAFTVALGGQNAIKWLLAQDFLLVGTSGSCGKWGEQGKAVTPTSPSYQEQTRNGSDDLTAIFAGDNILYVERGGRKVRRFGFDLQADKYISPEMTVLSPEITESGITNVAFQARPEPILWCVLENGDIATLTHQPEQSVVAWTKQVTDGDFESIAVISSGDAEDEVWTSVERVVNGNTNRYIEQFQPNDWGSDDDDLYFVDSGKTYSGVAEDEFDDLDHLEGETVKVWADGVVLSDEVVVGGEVTIDVASSTVAIGLPYTAKLETLPIRVDPQDIALNKKIRRLWVDLYKSGTFGFAPSPTAKLTVVNMWNAPTLTAKQDLYTSSRKMKQFPFTYAGYQKQTLYLESFEPVPLGVRAIVAELSARDR